MAKTIDEWMDEEVYFLEKKGGGYLAEHFCRDPLRPTLNDSSKFFSPADGILVFQKEVEANEPLVEVKGQFFTTKHLLDDPEFNDRALVISVYMTSYSVHYNRMPTSGFITYEDVDCLITNNLPMLAYEKNLFNKVFNFDNCNYLFYNERRISTIYTPKMDYTYLLVQTADADVNCISHFVGQREFIQQTNKFGMIHFGSQCTMVLPFPLPFNYVLPIETNMVVEAGVDCLLQTDFQTCEL